MAKQPELAPAHFLVGLIAIEGESDDADILTLGLFIDYDLGFVTLSSNTGLKDHDYYYDFYPTADGMLTESGKIKSEYTGCAGYANVGFEITERLNVELGVRPTENEKDFGTLVVEPDSYLGPYFTYGFSTDEYITDTQKWDDTTSRGLVACGR